LFELKEFSMAPRTRELFDTHAGYPWLSDFYLAGGTALALQLGHRTFMDLDFFTERAFNEEALMVDLAKLGEHQILERDVQSITGLLNGVNSHFLATNIRC